MKPAERQEILDDEFVRPKQKGVRLFSTGIIKLCRKLRINLFLRKEDKVEISEDRSALETLAMVWLLDERHSEEMVKERGQQGPSWIDSKELSDYDFQTTAEFFLRAQKEIAFTIRAIAAGDYDIEPNPDRPNEAQPKGNL